MKSRLFVINSSPAIRRLVEKAAGGQGYEVTAFSDGPSALEEAQRVKPEMIIADYQLEGLTCKTFCDKLNELDLVPGTRLVLLVNPSDHYDENGMRSRGVKAFLPKPFRPEQITQVIEELRGQGPELKQPARSSKSWPPETSAIGEEGDTSPSTDTNMEDDGLTPYTPSPGPLEEKYEPTQILKFPTGPGAHAAQAHSPNGPSQELQDAIGHVLSLLVQTLGERSNEGMAQTVSQLVAQQMGSQLQEMVQAAVSAQIATAMSGESLIKTLQEAVQQSLPAITVQLTSAMEPTLRQDLAANSGQVVEEIASKATERIVREVAEQKVGELVPTAVPDIAEAQIKKEIERLTSAP